MLDRAPRPDRGPQPEARSLDRCPPIGARSENLWHRFDRLTRHGNSTKKLASPCFFAIDQFFIIFPKVRYTLLHELEHAVYSAASCSRKTDTAN